VAAASAAAVVAAFVSLAHFDAMTTRGAARSCARVVAADVVDVSTSARVFARSRSLFIAAP